MTVIAYKDGVIASDSRVTYGHTVESDSRKKLFTLPDGVVGVSGDYHACLRLVRQMSEGLPEDTSEWPRMRKGGAILVRPDGVYVLDGGHWARCRREPVAAGSGFREAMAVMDFGGSAVDAVRAAIKRNIYCGGRVQSQEIR